MYSFSPDLSTDYRSPHPTTYPLIGLINTSNLYVQFQTHDSSPTAPRNLLLSYPSLAQLVKTAYFQNPGVIVPPSSHILHPIHKQILSTLPPQWPKPL